MSDSRPDITGHVHGRPGAIKTGTAKGRQSHGKRQYSHYSYHGLPQSTVNNHHGWPQSTLNNYHGLPQSTINNYLRPAQHMHYPNYDPWHQMQYSWGQRTLLSKQKVDEPMTITSHGGKRRLISTTPTLDTSKDHAQKTFDNWAQKEHGSIADQVEFMSGGAKTDDGEDSAAGMFLEFFRKKYPVTFEKFIDERGLRKGLKRMDAIQTCAVMSDVGLSGKQLEKLERHIKFHTGCPLFCSRKDRKKFTDDCPKGEVFSKKITHKDESIEMIHVLMHNLEHYLCAKMDREIEATYKSFARSIAVPMFSYALLSPKLRDGIYTLLGTDHGQEYCQFLIRLLLGNPKDCRRSGSADYQTKTINFCTVRCKKDLLEILELTKKNVNNALNVMRTKRMVGIEDKNGRVKTLFVENDLELRGVTSDVGDTDSCIIQCLRNGNAIEIKTKAERLDKSGPLKLFKVIDFFHNFQCGDYAAQFALQGRPGMSSCRCMHCNLMHADWNDMDKCTKTQQVLTFDDIKDGKNVDVGNTTIPTYPYDPLDCLSPILHGEIGSGNSQIDLSLVPMLINIDSATQEEYKILKQLHEFNIEITFLEGKIEQMGRISEDEELNKYKATRSALKKSRRDMKRKIDVARKSKLKNRGERMIKYSGELSLLDKELEAVESEIMRIEKSYDDEILLMKEKKRTLKDKRKVVVGKLDQLHTARKRKGGSLVSKFHDILKKRRIIVRAWHGGSLTGGHVVKLLRQSGEVMKELEAVCLERIVARKKNGEGSEQRPIPTEEYVRSELKKHADLFRIQDYVYSSLRIIDPTDQEYDMTEFFVHELQKRWKGMGLSTTCKMHFNFDHVCNQQRRIKGFGDKSEDWLERAHQEQLRFNRITFGMMPAGALELQAKLKWMANNPLIRGQIMRVHASVKRGFSGYENLSMDELINAANKMDLGWKEKYASHTKLKRKFERMKGAQAKNVNS